MPKLLYAEDEPLVADMVREYLKVSAPDWELEVVPDGRSCLRRMQTGSFDVLLVDLLLPDITGLQVITELAARTDPTPIIMVSSHGQNELAVQALRAGAVDCIDKASPQFFQIGTIVRQAHRRHCKEAAAARHAPPPPRRRQIVGLEGDASTRATWRAFLAQSAPTFGVTLTDSRAEFTRRLHDDPPVDAVVIGSLPDEASPLDLLRELRSLPDEIPAIVVSARDDSALAIAAIRLGARDFLRPSSSFLPELVSSIVAGLRQNDLERINRQLVEKLERLNQSLESEVAHRTRELVAEIDVRKAAEARLAALSSRLLRIQEDERRAFAHELHDQVGQTLTGLKLQLDQIPRPIAEPAAAAALTEAAATVQQLLAEVRGLTQQFRPQILDDLGVQPAVEWHATLFERQTGIKLALDFSLPPRRLGGELETVVFRTIQESLTNVARHSGATSAQVTVVADGEKLQVEISDRGRGFDVAAAVATRASIGLAGLRERVQLAGGRLEIFSQAGRGTRVHAELPLTHTLVAS
jgi:signal transduction histidine kinase